MRLQSPATEKRLRRAALLRVHAAPKLLREYRRMRRAHRDWAQILLVPVAAVGVLTITVLAPAGIAGLTAELPDGLEMVLGVASYLTTWTAWGLGCGIVQPLRKSRMLAVLSCLPVHDRDVVRVQSRQVVSASVALLIAAASFYTALAAFQGVGWREGVALVLLGLLQWPLVLSLTFLVAELVPRWMDTALATSMLVVPLMLLPASRLLPNGAIPVRQAAETVYRVLPGGWVNGAIHLGLMEGRQEAWWLLAPAVVLLAAGPAAAVWLRRRYVVREVSFAEKAVAEAVMERPEVWRSVAHRGSAEERLQRWLTGKGPDEEPERVPAAAARERVLGGEWLQPRDWRGAGMVERGVASVLDARERMIAELLTGDRVTWSRGVRRMAVTSGVVALLVMLLPKPLSGIAFYGLAALASQAFAGSWPAALWKAGDGRISPAAAYAPVGYGELIRVMTATACVRAMFMLPLAVALGAIFVQGFGVPIGDGAMLGLKAMIIYVASHRLGAAPFALGARSDRRRILRRVETIVVAVLLGLGFAGASMVFLIPNLPRYGTMLAAGAMFGIAWLSTRIDESHLLNKAIDLVADRLPHARRALER